MRHIKYISVLLALIFGISVFASVAFEAAEYDHDCIGEGCIICMALEMCDNILRLGSSAAAAAAVLSAAVLMVQSLSVAYKGFKSLNTLISLKVRLDN